MKVARASSAMSVLALALALCACGAGREEAKEPMPVEDTVVGDTIGAIDKARSVETTTQQHKEALDRAMEEAHGNH
jgi:hypothetical protein